MSLVYTLLPFVKKKLLCSAAEFDLAWNDIVVYRKFYQKIELFGYQ